MDHQSFHKARIMLTVWYVAILAVILCAFSFVLYTGEQHDFVRIIVQRDFQGRLPHGMTIGEREDVQNQLSAIRRAFLFNLLTIDWIVLLIGGGLSYFLAGKTLSPIQQTFQKQKTFLADVSHEIRTPLAAIQTATEVSLRSKEKTKEEYKHVLKQVYDSSSRLTKMANDLLLLSRMETANEKKFTNVVLSHVVTEAVQGLTTTAQAKEIDLTVTAEKKVYAWGDEQALLQLVMIFLDNAIKYTKQEGKIHIAVSFVGKPEISIQDTGIGIAKNDMEKIFERFYQADSSRSQPGNGLGLSIAKEILAAHKAKVTIESVVGKGTTFTIAFPAG